MRYTKSCGAIIFRSKIIECSINENNLEILLARYGTHHWGFPKGRMEEKEIEEETAIREVKEETGVDVVLDTRLRVVSNYSPKPNIIRESIFFAAEPVDANATVIPQLSEVSDAQWFDINEVETLVTIPGDYDLFLEALHFWRNRSTGV